LQHFKGRYEVDLRDVYVKAGDVYEESDYLAAKLPFLA
jgi:hypothetical protein